MARRALSRQQGDFRKESVMSKKRCDEGLDDRCRDQTGQIRAKNGSTLVRTLRDTYGEDFAPGVRSDMKLDTLLERTGTQSLTELLKKRWPSGARALPTQLR
jgi:hypothetical protein